MLHSRINKMRVHVETIGVIQAETPRGIMSFLLDNHRIQSPGYQLIRPFMVITDRFYNRNNRVESSC